MSYKNIHKKIFSLLYIMSFLYASSFTLAATTSLDVQVDGKVFNQANSEVQNIEVDFCGEVGKSKTYEVFAGTPQDICLDVQNTSDKDILVSLDFVDGVFTNDQWKNRACMDTNQKEEFGQYIFGNQKSFTIPAKGHKNISAQILYPEGSKGNFLGCIVYYTKGVSAGESVDFSVLVRRAKFIDVTVRQGFQSWCLGGILLFAITITLAVFFILKTKYFHKKRKTKKK